MDIRAAGRTKSARGSEPTAWSEPTTWPEPTAWPEPTTWPDHTGSPCPVSSDGTTRAVPTTRMGTPGATRSLFLLRMADAATTGPAGSPTRAAWHAARIVWRTTESSWGARFPRGRVSVSFSAMGAIYPTAGWLPPRGSLSRVSSGWNPWFFSEWNRQGSVPAAGCRE